MQGPARVGKTSVKCLILSKLYDSIASTGIAERPQVAVGDFSAQQFCQDEKKKWKLVTDDDFIEMFANDIKSLIEKDDAMKTQQNKEVEHNNEAQDGTHPSGSKETGDHSQYNLDETQLDSDNQYEESNRNAEVAQDKSVELPVPTTPNITSSTTDPDPKEEPGLQPIEESGNDVVALHALSETSSMAQTSSLADESNTAVKRLSDILSNASSQTGKLTLYKDWLYFIDSGGQIQFQQILQAFIPCASALMLVISLADSLSSQSSTELQCENGKKYKVSKHSLSIETLLKRLISMVNFSNHQEDMTSSDECLAAAIKPPDKLKVITIATHRDKYDELEKNGNIRETIAQKEGQLKHIFQAVKDNLLYENPVSGKILSEIDGSKAQYSEEMHDDNLKKMMEEIRDELRNQSFKVNIPLRWYAYEILLRHKARDSCGILPLEECISSGVELGLDKGEINSALKFLYLLNSILYYPENVSKLVFIDPYSLIQVVNELMVVICKIRSKINVGLGTCALPEMAKFGIITSEVFSHKDFKMFADISAKFHGFKNDLLDIFTYLLLAKKLPGNKPSNERYFMPALLPLIDPSEAVPFSSSGSTPLLFHFKNGVPVGFFCAMVVKLLSSEDYITDDNDNSGLYNDFSWSLDTKSTPEMHSNAIILRNDDLLGRVGLVESSDWFEIHCERREDQAEVKEAIENAIKETKKRRNIGKGMKLDIAFFCPCGEQPRHLAILNQHYRELHCNLPNGGCVNETKGSPCMSWIKGSPCMSWITSLKSNPGML